MSDAPSPQPAESMDDNSRFLLHSKGEIAFVLRDMIEKGALVTVYFQNNKSFILSALIEVNAEKNYLAVSRTKCNTGFIEWRNGVD